MKSCNPLFAALFSLVIFDGYSQHDHTATTAAAPLSFNPVLNQVLSDPDLEGYRMESTVMTVAPGAADTVAHRHDCELFGYVLEGEVQIGLEKKEPTSFVSGQMFYERRNVLHSLARNPDKERVAKVLLVFIIKEGRSRYTPAYPATK